MNVTNGVCPVCGETQIETVETEDLGPLMARCLNCFTMAPVGAFDKAVPLHLPDRPIILATSGGNQAMMNVKLPDDSIVLPSLITGLPEPLLVEPQFVVAPNGSGNLWPLQRTKANRGGVDVEILRTLEAEWKCPHCKKHAVMQGYMIESPPGEPDCLVQCPHCHVHHWLHTPEKRKVTK